MPTILFTKQIVCVLYASVADSFSNIKTMKERVDVSTVSVFVLNIVNGSIKIVGRSLSIKTIDF